MGVDAVSEHYNQNYTREEVEVILNKIKDCINDNQYIISQNQNRAENVQFITEYRLDEKKCFMYFAHKEIYLIFLEKKNLLIYILNLIL